MQVTKWSLSTGGEERQLVQIYNALGDPAFEFDTVTQRTITPANMGNISAGGLNINAILNNMRDRINELEGILRAVVKTIPPPP